ncbi:ABC transporter permease [Rhodovulum sp. 12E13]|uniref:ABC transporter permease n=1 Tax=Rhodovulum sp. 12E13 TaxID=2203891 RepID=UPI000E1317D2|nr:ABC transporter permease [Rhodovulum sp. 12E13]RDC69031.1 ABC transporter permease [Rhodovulum sp. 12E13]
MTAQAATTHAAPADAAPEATAPPPPRRAAAPPPLSRRLARRFATPLSFVFAWAVLLGLWELGAAAGWFSDRILPPPSQTIPFLLAGEATVGFGTQRTGLMEAISVTLVRISVGLVLGLVAAIGVAFLILQVKLLRALVLPIVQSIAPISPVAWVPFAIAIVGIGDPAAIFVVFMAIFGSMCCAAVAAFDSVPQEYRKVARSLGAGTAEMWRTVLLPAAAPSLMTMVRMSFFAAWMAVLAGEMAGINSGLGYLIIMGQQMYNMKLVMVGIIAIGVVGFALDRLLLVAQRRIVWWEDAQ